MFLCVITRFLTFVQELASIKFAYKEFLLCTLDFRQLQQHYPIAVPVPLPNKILISNRINLDVGRTISATNIT